MLRKETARADRIQSPVAVPSLQTAIADPVTNQYQDFANQVDLQNLLQTAADSGQRINRKADRSSGSTASNNGFITAQSQLLVQRLLEFEETDSFDELPAPDSQGESSQEDEREAARILEILAQEIYWNVRQRLERDRERREGGYYSGRLPW